ncbi:putative transposase-associated domain-containing protein [Tanacetum coccineum]
MVEQISNSPSTHLHLHLSFSHFSPITSHQSQPPVTIYHSPVTSQPPVTIHHSPFTSHQSQPPVTIHQSSVRPSTTKGGSFRSKLEFVDDTDFDVDFGSEITTDGPATVEMVNATKESFDEDGLAKFQELLLDAESYFTKDILTSQRISADGVNVNSGTRHHSVWPVLSVIYNLPPWLCMKRKFIMLSVLISRYPGNDIDVFLEPLVDDLHTLFETGVDTYDASTKENFNLCCVVCGKDTHCVRLSASSKQSYARHRRYLPYNHPFRRQKKAFNGQQEFQLAPNLLTGEQIYNEVQHIENKWGKGKQTNNKTSKNQEDTRGRGGKIQKQKRKTTEEEGSSNQVNEAYWKKFNIWYRKLRYWRHNSVPHCIDFMHVEKNVCESLVGTLLNVPGKTKDGMNA